jgi:threonine dehydratase
LGLEIIEDLPEIDAVMVPVGGGGLIAGTALAVKGFSARTEVIGVQTEAAPSAYRSFHNRAVTAAAPTPSLADGIAVGRVGDRPFAIISRLVDDMLLVEEEDIALAVLFFMERKKLVVEGAGAAPLGALLCNKERFHGKRVVLVASGGNIDLTLVDRILGKGLVRSGRIAVFNVIVDDLPGSLHILTGIIAAHRGNILDVTHNRLTQDLPVSRTLVTFVIEARSRDSLREILSGILDGGFAVKDH